MIGVDLDGTILNYDGHASGEIRIAVARLTWLAAQEGGIAILSNQGGVNFHDVNAGLRTVNETDNAKLRAALEAIGTALR